MSSAAAADSHPSQKKDDKMKSQDANKRAVVKNKYLKENPHSSFLQSSSPNGSVGLNSIMKKSKTRVRKTLEGKPEFVMSLVETQNVLEKFAKSKTAFVVLHVDLVGSTKMAMRLPIDRLTVMIQAFNQEMSIAVKAFGGYILKYVGDAVIAVFPSEFDTYKACEAAIRCAVNISFIIKQCINPAFKIHGLPEITVKMGVDYGDALVVLYGKSLHNAHIDLISSSMGITAKIASFAQPNEIVMGQSIYNIFLSNGKLLKALSIPILKKRIRHVKTDKLENS